MEAKLPCVASLSDLLTTAGWQPRGSIPQILGSFQ